MSVSALFERMEGRGQELVVFGGAAADTVKCHLLLSKRHHGRRNAVLSHAMEQIVRAPIAGVHAYMTEGPTSSWTRHSNRSADRRARVLVQRLQQHGYLCEVTSADHRFEGSARSARVSSFLGLAE